jgi:hypothetical protein
LRDLIGNSGEWSGIFIANLLLNFFDSNNRCSVLQSKFFSRQFFAQKNFPFPKYRKKIWREKNLLCKEVFKLSKRDTSFLIGFEKHKFHEI